MSNAAKETKTLFVRLLRAWNTKPVERAGPADSTRFSKQKWDPSTFDCSMTTVVLHQGLVNASLTFSLFWCVVSFNSELRQVNHHEAARQLVLFISGFDVSIDPTKAIVSWELIGAVLRKIMVVTALIWVFDEQHLPWQYSSLITD